MVHFTKALFIIFLTLILFFTLSNSTQQNQSFGRDGQIELQSNPLECECKSVPHSYHKFKDYRNKADEEIVLSNLKIHVHSYIVS